MAGQINFDDPGMVPFHSAQVFSGILDLSTEPGLVIEVPLTCS